MLTTRLDKGLCLQENFSFSANKLRIEDFPPLHNTHLWKFPKADD